MKRLLVIAVMLSACAVSDKNSTNSVDPYSILREAYLQRDATLAASAYQPDAVLTYQYETGVETYSGSDEIAASFKSLFDRVDPALTLDLNFRLVAIENANDHHQPGIYRLKFGDIETSYGRFETVRNVSSLGDGRFRSDTSYDATLEMFELAAGDVLLEPENETLERAFYQRLAGRYRRDDGCEFVVTRSVVRIFVRDTCSNSWRGLTRLSGLEWTSGDAVLSDHATGKYLFKWGEPNDEAGPTSLTFSSENESWSASRVASPSVRAVSFKAADGTTLVGDIYTPTKPSGIGTVLIHGSGPQDRDGYASIMAVMADALSMRGHTVLTYNKRGVGGSSGDWATAGFTTLAVDVAAAMERLKVEPDIDAERIGVAGSSQAGWIAAKLVDEVANPAHVFLLGAAGAALTVREQNLYNTEVRMNCAGIERGDIDLALQQQSAFFDYVETRDGGETLDALTVEGSKRPGLSDWLFPSSSEIDFDSGAWFTTLALDFDPMPIWETYNGRALFVFSEFDDSTPTIIARERIEPLILARPSQMDMTILKGSQHIGLRAQSLCASGLRDSNGFDPKLFDAFDQLAKQ